MTEKKLIPFNLERAKGGDKVATREGAKARIICFDAKDPIYPIIALITDSDDDEQVEFFTLNGEFLEEDEESGYDLFMAPKVTTYWANVYEGLNDPIISISRSFYSLSDAEIASCEIYPYVKFLKTISFEIEN